MQDILGRNLQDGDICVIHDTKQYTGLIIGVWDGNSIVGKDERRHPAKDIYKIVNPTNDEFAIANKIKERMNFFLLEDLVVGGIYKRADGCSNIFDGHDCHDIYLGKRRVISEIKYGFKSVQKKEFIQEGYCFGRVCNVDADEKSIKKNMIIPYFFGEVNMDILKDTDVFKKIKTLKELTRVINLDDSDFPIVREYTVNNEQVSNVHSKFVIESITHD